MLIAQAGSALLLVALTVAVFGCFVSFWSGARDDEVLRRVGRRALHAALVSIVVAAALLEVALLTHDYAITFVAEHIDSRLSMPLVASAFYAGQEGSLLYWTLALAVLGVLLTAVPGGTRLRAYADATLAALLGFLLLLLVFVASPFATLDPAPPDGLGLNPILRDQGMLIHPPVLLAGFSSFAVPFAFAAAALMAGGADRTWFVAMRRAALVSWALQTLGLTLGMWWAYHVLGWGGYWGWDPVENVALLPWLVTTGFIHSSRVEETTGRLRGWNLGLLLLAFCLSVFGTFVVRSGVIQSVHSFAVSALGPWFLAFLGGCVLGSLALFAVRGSRFRVQPAPEPAVSRESLLFAANILLLALVFAIFWGTMLPLLSGMFGQQAVVGAPFYQRVAGPLFLLLLALMAVGPLVPWGGRGSWLQLVRLPVLAAAGAAAGIVAAGARSPEIAVAAAVLAAAAVAALAEIARLRGHLAGRATRRRLGAALAHLGLLVVAAGIAGSQLGQQHVMLHVRPGQQAVVAGEVLTYAGVSSRPQADSVETTARLRLGSTELDPRRTVYAAFGGQSASGIAIESTPLRDVYVVLLDSSADGSATLDVFVNPLVTWIWTGVSLLLGGVLLGNLRLGTVRLRVPARTRQAALARPTL